MSTEDNNQQEVRFVEQLAALHEALAHDKPTFPLPGLDMTPEVAQRLHRAQCCLQLLEQDRRMLQKAETPWSVASADIPAHCLSPQRLGRYHLIRALGHGGYGIVYLAEDPLTRRRVALKVPRQEALFSADLRRRFLREGQAAARLSHPHLAPVYDVSEVGPFCFLVLPYYPAGNLAHYLRTHQEPVSARLAANVTAQLADAVQYMHEQGMLHRDIKPSNILLEAKGERIEIPTNPEYDETRFSGAAASDVRGLAELTVRLSDFGLAKLPSGVEGDSMPLTRSQQIFGTPAFMSPEQADGRLADVGPQSDIYALGVVLHELLTGRPPFLGANDAATIQQVLNNEPLPLRRLRREIPRDLETICLKCLEKEPRRRYLSAATLLGDLCAFLEGKPIAARPAGWLERTVKWTRRHPARTIALLGGTAALLASMAGAFLYALTMRENAVLLQNAVNRANEGDIRLRQESYASQIAQAESLRGTGRDSLLAFVLHSRLPGFSDKDVRGFEWRYLWAQVLRTPRILKAGHREWANVQFSSEGDWCASIGRDAYLRIWETPSGRQRAAIPIDIGRSFLANAIFSHDGRRLLCWAHDVTNLSMSVELTLWAVPTGKLLVRRQVPARPHDYESLGITPDGRYVAYVGNSTSRPADATVHIWDSVAENDVPVSPSLSTMPSPPGFSMHGNLLAITYRGKTGPPREPNLTEIWDTRAGRLITTLDAIGAMKGDMLFSPDGRMLATSSSGQTPPLVCLCDAQTGKVRHKLTGSSGTTASLAFSPDGKTLALGEAQTDGRQPDSRVSFWDVATGARLPRVFQQSSGVSSISFSPDNRALVVGGYDGDLRLFNLTDVPEDAVLRVRGQKEAWSVAFSPDSGTLAVGYDDEAGHDQETLKLWDARTGKELANLPHGNMVGNVAFLPDGRTLASAGYDHLVKLWDARTHKLVSCLQGHTDRLKCVVVSPNGTLLASAGCDKIVRVWDAAARKVRYAFHDDVDITHGLAFSPDSKTLAAVDDGGNLHLWEMNTGKVTRLIKDGVPLISLAFSPSGATLATGNRDGVVKLYDLETNGEPRVLFAHKGQAQSVTFSPDGNTLATGGADRAVRLWQVATSRELLAFKELPARINSLAFAPNGRHLAAAIHDGSVRVWHAAAND